MAAYAAANRFPQSHRHRHILVAAYAAANFRRLESDTSCFLVAAYAAANWISFSAYSR